MRFTRTMQVEAPRDAVWKLLADTERLDREVGLPPVEYEFQPRATGGVESYVTTRLGPLALRFRELPYEWIRPEFYRARRLFVGGPIAEFRVEMTLTERDGVTELHCDSRLLPRSPLFTPLLAVVGQKFMGDLERAWGSFAAYLTGQIETPYPKHSRHFPIIRERLDIAVQDAVEVGADANIVRRLAQYLTEAPPEDVTIMRPFVLADAWGMDRMAVLRAFLLTARERDGLLEMRWRLLCPSCRGSAMQNTHRRLREVRAEVHCPSCNIRFDADFDRSVEVCFAVAPRIRPVQEQLYCRGGPMMTPHVAAQWTLEAGETRNAVLNLRPGRYILVSPQASESVNIAIESGAEGSRVDTFQEATTAEETLSVPEDGSQSRAALSSETDVELVPGELKVASTRLAEQSEWKLANATSAWAVLRLESQEMDVPVATAALVTSLQAFRDQFSGEVLSPDTELSVRQICVLFSDLKGSTAMYRERGDAPSYRLVRDHFQEMRRLVEKHDGALVKTIGDSVMAAFADPTQGLAAAIAIQRAARDWPDRVTVKLGLHSGPAIAVNANDLLDYFGQTVNLAARLQSESEGGDIVIAEALAHDPLTARMLQTEACHLERFTHKVRGIVAPVPMLRITLPETGHSMEGKAAERL